MAPPAPLSQERVIDSSSEDDSGNSSSSSTKSTRSSHHSSSGTKSPEAVSSNPSISGDESSASSDVSKPQSTTNGVKRKALPNEPASGKAHKKSKSSSSQPTRVPAKAYQPPADYEPISLTGTDLQSLPSMNDVQFKEIWHITAPADVPITSIKSINLQTALQGDQVLEHDGVSYNLHAMPLVSEVLLLPNGNNAEYSKVGPPVLRNLHLREMVRTANQAHSSSKDPGMTPLSSQDITNSSRLDSISFTATTPGKKKTPRPQVQGLMMRYHPFGSGVDGQIRMAEPDRTENPSTAGASESGFSVPAELHSDADEVQTARTPKKNKKQKQHDKHKSPKSSQILSASQDAMDIDTPQKQDDIGTSREHKKKARKNKG